MHQLNEAARASFLQDLQDHNSLKDDWESDDHGFNGAVHVEANMLALHLLAQKSESEILSATNDSKERSFHGHRELPERSQFDRFKKFLNVLPVSERCCPPSYSLIEWMQKHNKLKDLKYPGHHRSWTAVSIPNWMPKEAGEAMIVAAETILGQRLRAFITTRQVLSPTLSDDSAAVQEEWPLGGYLASILNKPRKKRLARSPASQAEGAESAPIEEQITGSHECSPTEQQNTESHECSPTKMPKVHREENIPVTG